jgi:hypothetical protein
VSARSRRALARSTRGARALFTMLGLLALASGVVGLLVGTEVLGTPRSYRPVLDPIAVDLLRGNLLLARAVAVLAGLLLLVLGLGWAVRSVRPERRPDLLLDAEEVTSLRVTSSALSDVLAADAEALPGVARARARLVGSEYSPALRLTLWLTDGADVRTVWRDLEESVLSRARSSLGVDELPTAIRLELDRSASTTRVS